MNRRVGAALAGALFHAVVVYCGGERAGASPAPTFSFAAILWAGVNPAPTGGGLVVSCANG
jgi:hypothetical protein